MGLLNFLKKSPSPDFKKELKAIQKDFKAELFRIQGSIDAMTGEESASAYGTNNYRDYSRAVQAVNLKYENGSGWGNGLTANIVDFRAAVTVSSGPQYKPAMDSTIKQKDEEGENIGGENEQVKTAVQAFEEMEEDAEAEMDFCRDFFDVNDINHETPQEWGREAEIEGRVAIGLAWDEDKDQVVASHYPWTIYQYEEVRSEKNRKIIEKITWKDNESAGIKAGELSGDALVCRRFSGRLSSKYPTTKVMRCLTQIDYVDQAFRDWREINRLFASPVPDFEFKTKEEAEDFAGAFVANWKIKKALIHSGLFSYKGPDMGGIDSIEREIKRQACFISGTTGYPLQFLLPDMLSNRSTSENIMESALIHTASEREIWIGFYEELVSKGMALYTAKTSKTPLDPNKISISISLMTAEQWTRLTSFWLPAFRDDLVTREATLQQIPNFNLRDELDRREGADKSRVAEITKELDAVKAEADAAEKFNGNPFDKNAPAGGDGGKNDLK